MATKEEFFSCILTGAWQKILPEKIFQSLNDWLGRHQAEAKVVIRFTFEDSKHRQRFAAHFLCSPVLTKAKKIRLEAAHLPSQDDFTKAPKRLLSIPSQLRPLPLFSMPGDLLEQILD